jgi:TatD DNase family protein
LALAVPLAQLLIETDGPWPHEAPFSGQKTTPLLLPDVAKKVAAIRGVSEAFFAKQHRENIQRLYGVWK